MTPDLDPDIIEAAALVATSLLLFCAIRAGADRRRHPRPEGAAMTDNLSKLTGAQLYKQAMTKALIRGNRNLRLFLAGKIDVLPCTGDDQRREVIKTLDRLHAPEPVEGRE